MENPLGRRIAELRKRPTKKHPNGMTQGELADAVGCHKNTVLHAEKTGDVRVSTLRDFAEALGVEMGELLEHEPKRTPARRRRASQSPDAA